MRNQTILVMTATITPPADAALLARHQPELRRGDYEVALKHNLNALREGVFDTVIFAENSNSDVTSLQDIVKQAGLTERVTFLSFYGLDYPSEYSRGYGEFLLLDRVMASPQMRGEEPNCVVWKVTGRYRVKNIAQLVQNAPRPFDFYCHCRNHPMRLVDQYVLAWRAGAYEAHLKGLYKHFTASEAKKSSEQIMRDLLDIGHLRGMKVIPRFSHPPVIEGVRGWDGQEYSSGIKNRGKLLARRIANRTLPSLWI